MFCSGGGGSGFGFVTFLSMDSFRRALGPHEIDRNEKSGHRCEHERPVVLRRWSRSGQDGGPIHPSHASQGHIWKETAQLFTDA